MPGSSFNGAIVVSTRNKTPKTGRVFRGIVVVCCLALGARIVIGQPTTGQPGKKPETKVAPLTAETVKSRLDALEKNDKIKEPEKKIIKSRYDKALDLINAAAGHEKSRIELEQFQKSASQLESEANAELRKPLPAPKVPDVGELDLKQLETRQKAAKALKESADNKLKKWTADLKNRRTRREANPKRLSEAKEELKKAQADLKAEPPSNESAETVPSLRFLQRAQVDSLQKEVKALEAELPIFNETDKTVELLVKAAQHEVQRAENLTKYWDQKVEEHRGSEAREQAKLASTAVQNLTNAKMPAPLVEFAKQNLIFARQRTGETGTIVQLRKVMLDLNEATAELKKLEADRTDLEEKLKIPDIESDIGPLLVMRRRSLPNVNSYRRRINERSSSLSQLRFKYLNAQKMKNQVKDVAESVRKTIARDTSMDSATRTRAEAALQSLITSREKILDSLLNDYRTLLKQSTDLTTLDRRLIDVATKFHQLIDKHILWIPTTGPLKMRHIEDAGEAVTWLLDLKQWQDTGEKLLDTLFAHALPSTIAVFLLALVLFRQPTMKRRLMEIGEESKRGFTQPYMLTIKALMLTVILAVIWPAILWFLGRQLELYAETIFAESVGTALTVLAAALFTFEFFRRVLRRNGLAESHFRWKGIRLKQLRRNLRWFMLASLPALFLYALINEFGNPDHIASLGRLVLIGLLLVVSGFLAMVLRNPQVKLPFSDALGIEHSVAAKTASIWQVAAYLVVVLFPVALAIAAFAGYQYTAAFLAWKFLCTAWLGLVLLTCHALAMRWLYHARGKLAIEQVQAAAAEKKAAEEQAAAEQALAEQATAEEIPDPDEPLRDVSGQVLPQDSANGSALTPPGAPIPVTSTTPTPNTAAATETAPKPPVTDLAVINAQTRRLLQIAVGCGAVIGMWMIWLDVLPALKFLDYPLWSTSVETTRMVTAADKTTVPQTIVVLKAFTLGKLILTVAIVAVVFVAAANLPGLLEVAILQKLPIDSGARYAVTALARYSIYAAGTIAAFNQMGLSWSKVQWLIAALSVGLGFGLQEIVANFVSGVILLFERPLRVGDIVTVGDVSGSVTRIQIRATTIRDWDRKEYIVPNKELVTGKLMNWTLSDTINRIVINVGVDYGTDGDQVREILLAVADDHPEILKDPPPLASFEGFGDSSLNFVLRCFLPELAKRILTIHQLHSEIQKRLADAGIGIPFPQRDLHIVSDATRSNGETADARKEESITP